MLIKYLNDLDRAVQKAKAAPCVEHYRRCADCVMTLETYLDSQLEPLRRRGFEIMEQLLPSDYPAWQSTLEAARHQPMPSQLAGSL